MPLTTHVSGACIRLAEDGPYIHVNGSHTSPLVSRVEIEDNWLVIYNDVPVPGAACSSVVVSPDEMISGTHGVIGGASGGNYRTRVRLYSTKLGRQLRLSGSDYDLISGSVSNIWIQWVHTSEADADACHCCGK